jgi:hypothetical protein
LFFGSVKEAPSGKATTPKKYQREESGRRTNKKNRNILASHMDLIVYINSLDFFNYSTYFYVFIMKKENFPN